MLDTYQNAAQSLVDMVTVKKSAPFRARLWALSWDGVDPVLLEWSQCFLSELHSRGFPFFPHCYMRDEATQQRLLNEGRTRARYGASPHNYGYAVDIVHFGRFWELSKKEWDLVGVIGKEVARRGITLPIGGRKDPTRIPVNIEWGGDWKFYDPAHWEIKGWKSLVKGRPKELVRSSFKQAFNEAWVRGDKTFVWRGATYTTERA